MFPPLKNSSDETTRKLNYIIHNPNSEEETINVLLEVFVQTNEKKIEQRIKKLLEDKENISKEKLRKVSE